MDIVSFGGCHQKKEQQSTNITLPKEFLFPNVYESKTDKGKTLRQNMYPGQDAQQCVYFKGLCGIRLVKGCGDLYDIQFGKVNPSAEVVAEAANSTTNTCVQWGEILDVILRKKELWNGAVDDKKKKKFIKNLSKDECLNLLWKCGAGGVVYSLKRHLREGVTILHMTDMLFVETNLAKMDIKKANIADFGKVYRAYIYEKQQHIRCPENRVCVFTLKRKRWGTDNREDSSNMHMDILRKSCVDLRRTPQSMVGLIGMNALLSHQTDMSGAVVLKYSSACDVVKIADKLHMCASGCDVAADFVRQSMSKSEIKEKTGAAKMIENFALYMSRSVFDVDDTPGLRTCALKCSAVGEAWNVITQKRCMLTDRVSIKSYKIAQMYVNHLKRVMNGYKTPQQKIGGFPFNTSFNEIRLTAPCFDKCGDSLEGMDLLDNCCWTDMLCKTNDDILSIAAAEFF